MVPQRKGKTMKTMEAMRIPATSSTRSGAAPTPRRWWQVVAVVALAALVVVPVSCGDDDDDGASGTTTTTATTTAVADEGTTTSASAGPGDVFCQAAEDFSNAQDGAQRNTALGNLLDALPTDAPAAVGDALTTLDTGDLSASDYAAAEDTLQQYADDNCT